MFNLQLTCVDIDTLHDTYTYFSDDGMRMSWIDHILCRKPIVPFVPNINVLDDKVCSDHICLFQLFCSQYY